MHWSQHYLGIPWRTGGRDVRTGLDCWGLLRYIYQKAYNIELSEHAAALGTLASNDEVVFDELSTNQWAEIENGVTVEDGDVVAMGKGAKFSHVCVLVKLEQICVIHTARKCLSCIKTLKQMREDGWDNIKVYRHVKHCSNN